MISRASVVVFLLCLVAQFCAIQAQTCVYDSNCNDEMFQTTYDVYSYLANNMVCIDLRFLDTFGDVFQPADIQAWDDHCLSINGAYHASAEVQFPFGICDEYYLEDNRFNIKPFTVNDGSGIPKKIIKLGSPAFESTFDAVTCDAKYEYVRLDVYEPGTIPVGPIDRSLCWYPEDTTDWEDLAKEFFLCDGHDMNWDQTFERGGTGCICSSTNCGPVYFLLTHMNTCSPYLTNDSGVYNRGETTVCYNDITYDVIWMSKIAVDDSRTVLCVDDELCQASLGSCVDQEPDSKEKIVLVTDWVSIGIVFGFVAMVTLLANRWSAGWVENLIGKIPLQRAFYAAMFILDCGLFATSIVAYVMTESECSSLRSLDVVLLVTATISFTCTIVETIGSKILCCSSELFEKIMFYFVTILEVVSLVTIIALCFVVSDDYDMYSATYVCNNYLPGDDQSILIFPTMVAAFVILLIVGAIILWGAEVSVKEILSSGAPSVMLIMVNVSVIAVSVMCIVYLAGGYNQDIWENRVGFICMISVVDSICSMYIGWVSFRYDGTIELVKDDDTGF